MGLSRIHCSLPGMFGQLLHLLCRISCTFQRHRDMEAFDSGDACGDAFGLKSAGAMAVKTLQVGDPWQKIGSPGRCNCCL